MYAFGLTSLTSWHLFPLHGPRPFLDDYSSAGLGVSDKQEVVFCGIHNINIYMDLHWCINPSKEN